MSTEHDQAVLNAIFNPHLPIGEQVHFQPTNKENDESVKVEEEESDSSEARTLEIEGVRKAEAGMLSEAVEDFTLALRFAPQRSSLYNNRAQAYRLMGDDDAALSDLNRAIELSLSQGEVAKLALCQRALVRRRRGEDTAAGADLHAAAKLGSDFAKKQLVQTNPYAAMCNQMLQQMFTKLNQPG